MLSLGSLVELRQACCIGMNLSYWDSLVVLG